MPDNKIYERLFCFECSKEVLSGDAALTIPALQPGTGGTGGSPRPHVLCMPCYQKDRAAVAARPDPSLLHNKPSFVLHHYIWSIGEGRTDAELIHFHLAHGWPTRLPTMLRDLTAVGKIGVRRGRRVALCAPWQEPRAVEEPVVQDAERAAVTAEHGAVEQDPFGYGYGKPGGYDGPSAELPDDAVLQQDALPTPEELQADRYGEGVPQVDLQDIHNRLKAIERLALTLLERVDHLVCMDNERDFVDPCPMPANLMGETDDPAPTEEE